MNLPNGLVYGFHGTTEDQVVEILASGYKPSAGDAHWLGSDLVYFYEDPALAEGWAAHWAVPKFGGEPALLRSVIDLSDCLDLTQTRYKHLVAKLGATALKHLGAQKVETMKQNHGLRQLDSFVLDQVLEYARSSGTPFKTVRAICSARNGPQPERIFPPEGPIFRTDDMQSWFDLHDHIQIGVADQAAILETVRLP